MRAKDGRGVICIVILFGPLYVQEFQLVYREGANVVAEMLSPRHQLE